MFEPSIALYDDQVNNDVTVAILLLALWAVLARGLYRLPFRKTAHKLRRASRWLFAGTVLAVLLVPTRLVTILVLGGYGSHFAMDRLWIGMPLAGVPAIFALVLTLPRLKRFAVEEVPDRTAAPTDEQRLRAAAPAISLPARAAAIGSLVTLVRLIFAPAPPLFVPVLVTLAVVGAWVLVLSRRHRARTTGGTVRPMLHGRARTRRNLLGTVTVLALVAAYAAWDWQASRLPDSYSMMDHTMTYGSGPAAGHGHLAAGSTRTTAESISVADLTGPRTGTPDKRFTLTATEAKMNLSSGAVIDAVVFNGQLPGPELRVREGDLVEVTLVNKTRNVPTTIHWHGIDVPNAEDGVAGVTQDAVAPGKSHTYRWVAGQTGTYWYHSHQQSSTQVRRGLFGPLVIEKKDAPQPANVKEFMLSSHVWDTDKGEVTSLNADDTLRREAVAPGTPVRIRLVNSDNFLKTFTLTGAPYKVTALDGNDVNAPTDLSRVKLPLGGGGRYDLEFVMPDGPVRFADLAAPQAGLLLSPDGKGELAPLTEVPEFDPTRYGTALPTEFGPDSTFDRSYELILDNKPGFFDGNPYYLWTINGSVFPDVPMLMVREGELVKMTIVNRSFLEHPMHLHGHRVLVLSRNGKRVTGSPVWLDTITIVDGETYEVAFKADNPGLWMDHCHNLTHAAMGMTVHLGYENVHTPYRAGRATGNVPE
ncbi:FtsP/CotA-like multicopper oxidase with cupredoxin domain [Nonomuraea polychroma]|uniref:FtsP/CotA-like multicopper oxidase with cupredoxin domain n=1 Tax=Nonomuraea polychroma TaxID=46176 RepID=A0A438MF44_9ACTN|nr:multicopper oxidase family protein [Nonomuraea polychroma]RVX44145.1 FtsP/CotA-like multicopper oxidase with cupredoxin domain [Nonomuraea polychroma]